MLGGSIQNGGLIVPDSKAGYFGGLVPFRRATGGVGFNPSDVAGLALWLDASDTTTLFQLSDGTTPVSADLDPVGYWGDKSGNGRHETQATAANRPLYRTNVKNGLPVVRGDGSNDFLRATFTLDQPFTAFVVSSQVATVAQNKTILGGVTNDLRIIYKSTQVSIELYATNAEDPIVSTGDNANWIISTSFFSGASSSLSVNAGAATVGNPGSVAAGGVTLLAMSTNGEPGNVNLGEVLVYTGAVSAGDKTLILAYLNSKWSVY